MNIQDRNAIASSIVCALYVLLGNAPLEACPYCNSDTGRSVRAEIFGNAFALNLGLVASPLVVLLLVLMVVQFGLRTKTTPSSPGIDRGASHE